MKNLNELSEEEKKKLEKGKSRLNRELLNRLRVPIVEVLKSPCVWACWICHICFDWGNYTFFTNIPKFMKEVLFFDIQANGLLSAVPYIVLGLVSFFSGPIADFILNRFSGSEREKTARNYMRKISSGIGMIVPGGILCLLWFTDCTRTWLAIIFLTLGVAITGICYPGWVANYLDISGRYSGILFAIGNTASALTGYAAPALIGVITSSHTQTSWAIAFIICGGILAAGGIVYVLLSQAETQKWAQEEAPLAEKKETTNLQVETSAAATSPTSATLVDT